MQLGAIDIGSNAVRLLVAEAWRGKDGLSVLKKEKLYRIPVRLGVDAFGKGIICEHSEAQLMRAMQAFRHIMDVYGVTAYRACATSALRDSKNANDILKNIRKKADINIDLISGDEEAAIILDAQLNESQWLDKRFAHLHVDVGGGSTEITLRHGTTSLCAHSFQIGTVRLFEQKVQKGEWSDMAKWLAENVTPKMPLAIIGSGGNINSIFKRSDNHDGEPLLYDYIRQQRNVLRSLDVDDRILMHNMNRDRAEVIVYALDIFLFVMEQAQVKQVFVPKIGLVDGIMDKLYDINKNKI